MKPSDPKKYMDSKQLAERFSVAESSIRRQRMQETGPPYVRLNGRIYYEIAAVDKWEKDQLKPIRR